MTAEQTWGSDSPHVADALRVVPAAPAASDGQAVVHALLAAADELAEARRQQHADAIDLSNAISALATESAQPRREVVGRQPWRPWQRWMVAAVVIIGLICLYLPGGAR